MLGIRSARTQPGVAGERLAKVPLAAVISSPRGTSCWMSLSASSMAATLTPGLVKEALAARFRNFEAFRLMPETRRKSGPTRHTGPPALAAAA